VPALPAAAVVYVKDLPRMTAFYERRFGMAVADAPTKLVFAVEAIEPLRSLVARLGGQLDRPDRRGRSALPGISTASIRRATSCNCANGCPSVASRGRG
jgi:hypothetical protein